MAAHDIFCLLKSLVIRDIAQITLLRSVRVAIEQTVKVSAVLTVLNYVELLLLFDLLNQ